MTSQCKFKMKWFSGNSSTNAEGKLEYHEPKLLKICRIPGYDDVITTNIQSNMSNSGVQQMTGNPFILF